MSRLLHGTLLTKIQIVYKNVWLCAGIELCKQILPTKLLALNFLVGKKEHFRRIYYI